MAETKYTDQGSAIDPEAIQYTDQGSAIDPEAIQYTDQGSAIDPEAIQYTDQGSAIDPEAIQYTDQGPLKIPNIVTKKTVKTCSPKPIPAAHGTEGELIILDDGTAIKRYKSGFKCNAAILAKVKEMSGKGYLADIIDFGSRDFDGKTYDFEQMKYYPLGSVSKYNLKGNAEAITRIVAKIALSLDVCHKKGFIHKDVKPANILLCDKGTWDCVLCDFGFADFLENGKVSTIQNRTPIYAAPEVYDPNNVAVISGHTYCTLTAASDFYSLGMTALCLWNGEKAFLAKEAELAIEKRNDKIIVGKDIPDPLNKIIRGLLVNDPAHRWGLDEIRRTIKGEDVKVYAGGLEVIFNGQKNLVAHSPEELATMMLSDQKLARAYLYSGQVSKWLVKFPEMKIEIDRIVEKDFPKDEVTGLICSAHIMNPLYDINLHTPKHPDYAMTGEAIGCVLNDAYNLYYGKFAAQRTRVIAEWNAECSKKVNGSAILLRLIGSFTSWSEKSYLEWFFLHKGNRFKNQISWMKYCLDFDSRDNRKKAGPKDIAYLEQMAMMKTIAGFGYTPTYDYTSEGAGLRGYIAVKYHENPKADLSKKYAYEQLLEKYLIEYRRYNPKCDEGRRFDYACKKAEDTAVKAKRGAEPLVARDFIQHIIALVFAGGPALYLLICAVNLVMKYPSVEINGIDFGMTFALIGAALTVIFGLLMGEGCVIPIIAGLIVGTIFYYVFKFLSPYVFWMYAAVILVIFIVFLIKVVFKGRAGKVDKMKTDPGFMELVLEPLYYAFNDESDFTSSLSAYIDDDALARYRVALRKRRTPIIVFILLFWAIVVGQYYLSKLPDHPESGIQITLKEKETTNDQLQ